VKEKKQALFVCSRSVAVARRRCCVAVDGDRSWPAHFSEFSETALSSSPRVSSKRTRWRISI